MWLPEKWLKLPVLLLQKNHGTRTKAYNIECNSGNQTGNLISFRGFTDFDAVQHSAAPGAECGAMTESELKQIVRGALASLPAESGERDAALSDAEAELTELLLRQLPGSDREAILRLVRECVTEARAGRQG